MSYEAFAISDFKTGLYEAREPWLSPADAFSTVNNLYPYRGVYKKRAGYSQLAQMNHYQKAVTGATSANPVVITSASHGISNGTSVLLYGFVGGMTELNGNTYTVANAATNTFELSGVDGSGYSAYSSGGKIATFQTNAIMGIKEFTQSDGTKQLLVFDTLRAAYFNTTTEVLEDINESDTFTGDNEDFFWVSNWKGKAYITNNVDRLATWDGSSFANLDVDTDGDTNNDLNRCLLVFPFKNYLCLLRTREGGTDYPQRVRWSKLNDPTIWDEGDGGGFVDAPTSQWITGAHYSKDAVIVFFQRSVWALRFVGDVDLPFRWDKIAEFQNDSLLMEAPHSVVSHRDQAYAYGTTSFIAADQFQVGEIDSFVPDLTISVNQDKTNIVNSGKLDKLKQIWVTYPETTSTTSNKVGVFNYSERTWTTYDLAITCFGTSSLINTITWNSETRTWNQIADSWNNFPGGAGFPTFLGGDQNGIVRQLNTNQDDNGSDISLEWTSTRWNPYAAQGKRAKLGWIDFLVSHHSSATVTIEFYVDFDSVAYQTSTLDFAAAQTSQEKVWKRLNSGAIGGSHRIKISHTASNETVQFHAIIPYFEMAGDLIV